MYLRLNSCSRKQDNVRVSQREENLSAAAEEGAEEGAERQASSEFRRAVTVHKKNKR